MSSRSVRLGWAFPLLVFSAGLGCSGDGGPTEDEAAPTISITVSPTSVTLTPGPSQSGQARAPSADLTVSLTRGGGFTGVVTVSVEGTPTGVSASLLIIPSASTRGTLSLSATPSVSAGSHTLTVRATGSGVTDATATVSLTIEEG